MATLSSLLGNQFVGASGYSGYSGISLQSYTTTIGNNSSTSFTVTHNLNQENVVVTVRDVASGYFVYPDIDYIGVNSVVLEFVTAPSSNQYKVIVLAAST